MNKMKEIRVESVSKIIDLLIIGKCNSLALLAICKEQDVIPSDLEKEYLEEIAEMESKIIELERWYGNV